jgi:ATP-dependent protease ClpP protease subunit
MQFALTQGRNDWYRIRNQANGPTQVHIYDEIGYFGVSAMDFARDLADVTGPVEVHLNSPGGEVYDGITIYNTLLARKDVAVYIDGMAASIASVIAMAGNPVLIARQARMMIHDGFTMAIGNAQDLRDTAEQLDRASNNIASIYSEHTGRPIDYWRALMKSETWFDAQETVDLGLCDRFIENGNGRSVPIPTDKWDMSVFRNQGRPQDAASVPYVGRTEPRHIPTTVTHTHDHGAFGHPQHDDGMHSHAHTHDGDANHDHSHPADLFSGADEGDTASVYGDLGMNHVSHFLIAEATILNWNASAALSKCKTAADFRSVCAGEHTSGDPDTAAHWALPHHNSPGAGPDKGGVVAALGRWNQTEGLKNKAAALTHLKAHAKTLGLPSGDDHTQLETYSEADAALLINALKEVTR